MNGKAGDKPKPKPKARATVKRSKPSRPALAARPEDDAELFAAGRLLERCRTKWQHGDWPALAALAERQIENDADRGKVAILVASAHGQMGAPEKARHFAQLALDWGCARKIVLRLLLSSVHNSLGRMTIGLNRPGEARRHFNEAISLGDPRADTELLARTRQIRETARAGFLSQAAETVEQELRKVRETPATEAHWMQAFSEEIALIKEKIGQPGSGTPESQQPGAGTPALPEVLLANRRFDEKACRFYAGLDRGGDTPFLYLETKSLPRSGLHYLRNRLAAILGGQFSFCEWYTEPGCCKRMPCAVTGYARTKTLRLRMVKSHDFDHADPVFPTRGALRRMVLVRDPLFVLTSWWTLQLLQINAPLLARHGIEMDKINYLHEGPVVANAHELVAQSGILPEEDELAAWLDKKKTYITNFLLKWGGDPDAWILSYEQVPQAIIDLLAPWQEHMDAAAKDRFDTFRDRSLAEFSPRSSPFQGPSDIITKYLEKHGRLFREAAENIVEADTLGFLNGAL